MKNLFWESAAPSVEALARFESATDDEFPHSYSGQAWRAAYRLWLAIKDKTQAEIDKAISDPYGYDPDWNWGGEKGGEDLGLSGFMACEPLPATGPAEGMMREAIGGREDSPKAN